MADEGIAWKLPRLQELAQRFTALGLAPVLDEIAARATAPEAVAPGSDPAAINPDIVAASFDCACYQSIMDEIRVRDPAYAADDAAALDENDAAKHYRSTDAKDPNPYCEPG